MGRPRRRGGDGGLGMRSIRRNRWTRTVSWVIMKKPPRVACMDTRHLRRLLASEQVLMRFSIYDRTSLNRFSGSAEARSSQPLDVCSHLQWDYPDHQRRWNGTLSVPRRANYDRRVL